MVEWKHFLSDVFDVADQTGTVRGCIVKVTVSICRRLIVDTSPMCSSVADFYDHMETRLKFASGSVATLTCESLEESRKLHKSFLVQENSAQLLKDVISLSYV